MRLKTSWMNVYRAGYLRERGQPSALDFHGGDFYDTPLEAMQHIAAPEAYVGTVQVTYPVANDVTANAADSVPVPLEQTRPLFRDTDSGEKAWQI